VTYVGAWYQSGEISGPAITVAVGSDVAVHLSLQATGNMRGELRTEVWKEMSPPPDGPVQTCSKAPTLFTGTQAVWACDFSAAELTGAGFTKYFLKAYWNGSPLVELPVGGEGVMTTPR
jgi:hypothetical protein